MSIEAPVLGFARAYTLFITFGLIMIYFIKHEVNYLFFAGALGFNTIFNQILKDFVFKKIMGSTKYPIFGIGKRPKGATDCGNFINIKSRKSTTYGMPSGHSSFAAFFAVVTINQILDENYSDNIKMIKISIIVIISGLIMFSRVNLGCHTIQQVIVGGILGTILGYLYYLNLDKIKSLFKIK